MFKIVKVNVLNPNTEKVLIELLENGWEIKNSQGTQHEVVYVLWKQI